MIKISNSNAKKKLKGLFTVLPMFVICGVIFYSGYSAAQISANANGYGNQQFQMNKSFSDISEEDLSLFWKTWNLIDQKYISISTSTVTNSDRIYGAISGMVNSLGDPYTVFLKPEAHEGFQESIKGNFSGVGMEVGKEENLITVIAPLKNTPAEKAGIRSGDKVIEIDGVSSVGMELDVAVKKIRGEVGTDVVLTVMRDDEKEPLEITITRAIIDIPTMDYELRGDGIYEISMYNFSSNSASDFRNALRSFVESGSTRLLLDLRGNPGGFLESAIDVASWFLPTGKIVVQEDFGRGEIKLIRSKGYNIFDKNLKMVILIDKGSASGSEIVAGALREHGVATLVGDNTFGKGSVQELIDIDQYTSLKVTIARWLTPNGKSISENGLTPDILISELPEEERGDGWEDLSSYDKYTKLREYQKEEAIKILENN